MQLSWLPLASSLFYRWFLQVSCFAVVFAAANHGMADVTTVKATVQLEASTHVNVTTLAPFTTDGCSAFPDGTPEQNQLWQRCCTQHDLAYWQGGIYKQRLEADIALRNCVAEVGEQDVAELMLAGVRVGGSPFWPTPFRWGYGWPYPRFYGPLSASEAAQVKALYPTGF